MAERELDVWCFEEHAGTLSDEEDGFGFAYAESWRDAGRPPLSQCLPLDCAFERTAVAAFFGGLLPEGAARELVARNLGVSPDNDFALLAALAGDTAGAITLLAPGERPAPARSDVEWLSDDELGALIDDLPRRPLHADAEGGYRLSLAGVQDKLPVVVDEEGRVGLTKGDTPSTHILKTAIERFEGTIVNEALCLRIGAGLGVDVAKASPRRAAGRELLPVERYDRERIEGGTRRLHQEDFCQALGIPARRKYQSEGGPGLGDCFGLVRRAVDVPARDAVKLLDAVVLSFLVGNHDGHGKNFSLLYLPGLPHTTLSPAYDVLCTVVYPGLSRKMAMSIGGEYRPEYVRSRHLDRLLEEAGLAPAAARRRLRAMAADAPKAAAKAREELAAEGWDSPVLGRIVEIVEWRARMLAEIASAGAASR